MMSRVKHIRLILAAFLVLSAGCDRGSHPRQMGRVAPEFTVTDGNHSLRLADYRGKVVILNFWATWCIPCIAELPSLTAMQQKLPQVQVIAVSIDVDQQAYRQYVTEHKISLLTIDDPAHRAAVPTSGRRHTSSTGAESSGASSSGRRTGPAPRSWNTCAACRWRRIVWHPRYPENDL
jgi:thiol-disulfide isomerase/thioredoxin